MSEQPPHPYHLFKVKKESERDPAHYFRMKDDEGQDVLAVGLLFDSFFVAWSTQLEIKDFLSTTSHLLDRIAKKRPRSRHQTLGNIASRILSPGQSATIGPSYSGFGTENVFIDSEDLKPDDLRFKDLAWPLSLDNIAEVARQKGGIVQADDPNFTFIRVQGKYCNTTFNGDRWPRSFTYWSHLYPVAELTDVYRQTTTISSLSAESFQDNLQEVLNPYLGKNYFAI